MTAPADSVQPRNELGHWQAGPGANVNPAGKNQWSDPNYRNINHQVDLAIERKAKERPTCVESFADKFFDALEDPHGKGNLALLYLMKDRIAGLLPGDQPADSGAEATSQEQWRQLASDIRVEAAEADAVSDAEVVAEPDEGAA